SKSFDGVQVVRDVSFAVNRREILGFLGPNGAGKTTTIRMIIGIIQPDRGEIQFALDGGSERSIRSGSDICRRSVACTRMRRCWIRSSTSPA
ncbi:MAG TPA: ATP-binding cassette domain-containing protein, partial [Candidatus Acetothermia bacterium]|nr:ATP-binding cassette domain-containing protein [Candidatus Acetothermia bacterium]